MSKAERAWFLSRRERRAKPVSERDFLAGEIPRVFTTLSLSVCVDKRKADVRMNKKAQAKWLENTQDFPRDSL